MAKELRFTHFPATLRATVWQASLQVNAIELVRASANLANATPTLQIVFTSLNLQGPKREQNKEITSFLRALLTEYTTTLLSQCRK